MLGFILLFFGGNQTHRSSSRWRYKIFFDYILLNNHRLSAVIFPSIQTRLYVTITILLQIGVCDLFPRAELIALFSGRRRCTDTRLSQSHVGAVHWRNTLYDFHA